MASEGPVRDPRRGPLVAVLDLVLAVLSLGIVGVVLVGRFDRAWIADHHVAEPMLALALLLPVMATTRVVLARAM